MASVRDRHKYSDKIAYQYGTPTECVLSEGDKLIRDLVQKQISTNIELKSQLEQSKEFEKSTEFVPLTSFTCGQNSLKTFRDCAERINNIEELKFCGLTDYEIELFFDNKKGEEYAIKKHKNICKNVLQEQLNNIYKKINKAKNDVDSENQKNCVPRSVKELALSVKPESEETKLYKFALSCSSKSSDLPPKNHPINNLNELEKDLFGHLEAFPVPSLEKRRKKIKKLERNDNNLEFYNKQELSDHKTKSKWDVKEKIVEKPPEKRLKKEYTCKEQNLYTIRDNKIVKLNNLETVKENSPEIKCNNDIEESRNLTEEEIKKLPRFQNYDKGTPSKVLYIKNLAKSVKEEDLIGLFNRFEDGDNRITYRLLKGKMRGQAFLTFESVIQATETLETMNGYILKNKPIIIEYGKTVLT